MAEGTRLPGSLRWEGEPFSPGWKRVKNLDSNEIDRALGREGWSFFYLAGVIEMRAFGSDTDQAIGKAIRRIIGSVKTKSYNCLEITQVAAKRTLGFPYVNVSAHPRHIQAGLFLFEDEKPAQATSSAASAASD